MGIADFVRNNFSGYLSNRYQITIPNLFPNGIMKFEAAILQLPGSEIKNSPIGFWGRQVNIPMTRSFQPLIMTVYDSSGDGKFKRTQMEEWMNRIDRTAFDKKPDRSVDEYKYTDDVIIEYLQDYPWLPGLGGSAYNSSTFEKKLTLKSAWPSFIGPLELSNESSDWARYELQLTYDYYY